ncbi:MAG: hypothetical protein ACJ8H8_21495, partial [Geminicoccaceae bacterium]
MRIKLTAWIATLLISACLAGAKAQETPAPPPAEPPAEVRELVDLLRKPAVQDWLMKGAPAAPAPGATTEAVADLKEASSNLARDFRRWVADTRGHVAAIRDGAEQIPHELSRIGDHLAVEIEQQGFWQIAIFAGGLLLLGYGCQQLFWMAT